jgi:Leucine-rich repeat (LRR) protein
MHASQRSAIPGGVLQVVSEYECSPAGWLAHRAVSRRWHGAVGDALGFLNGRRWTELRIGTAFDPQILTAHAKDSKPESVIRCTVLCLRGRVTTLTCHAVVTWCSVAADRLCLPPLGNTNDVLQVLTLQGTLLLDAARLQNFTRLRSLTLCHRSISDADMYTIAAMPTLEKLDLSGCTTLSGVAPLQGHRALRELNVSRTLMGNLHALETIPRLRVFVAADCPHLGCVANLQGCHGLAELRLGSPHIGDEAIRALGLARLRRLDLSGCRQITSVASIQICSALRELDVHDSSVDNQGIIGLEQLTALTKLNLGGCSRLDNVTSLGDCPALRELRLARTSVRSVAGLERIPTLERLFLTCCVQLVYISALQACPMLRELNVFSTAVSTEEVAVLGRIESLQILDLRDCKQVTSVAGLERVPSLFPPADLTRKVSQEVPSELP